MTPLQELAQLRNKPRQMSNTIECYRRCINHMLKSDKHWHYASEFVGDTKGGWLSYKGAARIQEVSKLYPDLVEEQKVGRFSVFRLKTRKIPKELK